MNAKTVPVEVVVGPSEYFRPMSGEVFAEFLKAVHLEREMREVGLHLHRAGRREAADFNFLIAPGRLEKNEFGAARRFVPLDFLEAQYVTIKIHRAFQIVHAVARVQQFAHPQFFHARGRGKIARCRPGNQPIETHPLMNIKPMATAKRRILFFTRKLFRRARGDAR